MMRIILAIVVVLASLVTPATRAAAATCTPDIGPGIAPPTTTPTKLPGFHAAWFGQSGYMRLCLDGPVVDAGAIETALVPGSGH